MVPALFAASSAHAGLVDLGIGGANLYTLGDFKPTGSDVEGAAVVAGNALIGNVGYAINHNNKDAYGDYALVVGGDMTFYNGSVSNGKYYVGGTLSNSQGGSLKEAEKSTTLPLSFETTSANALSLSSSLADVKATGTSATTPWNSITLTGSGSGVEVFDISSSALSVASSFSFNNLTAGDTIIFNISGGSAAMQNVSYQNGFSNYNVLFNFYEATNLYLNGVGVYGSILAPLATVTGGNGQINGNVIVDTWNSNAQINSNNYFVASDLAGFTSPVSPVPEPGTAAMLLAGLGLVGFAARRKPGKQA